MQKWNMYGSLAVLAAMVLTVSAACGGGNGGGGAGGGTANPAKVNLDGVWKWGAIESHPEETLSSDQSELFMPLSNTLTISGNTYTDENSMNKGTFKRTKTEFTFLPQVSYWEGAEQGEPYSAERKKQEQRKVPFSVAEDTLTLDGKVYRRAYTGKGAEYTGTMVRGRTRLDITLTIGGFEDGKLINSFYFYNRRKTPIKLEGELAGTLLILEEGATLTGEDARYPGFYFEKFDPESDAVTGVYAVLVSYRPVGGTGIGWDDPYDVTLTRKKQ